MRASGTVVAASPTGRFLLFGFGILDGQTLIRVTRILTARGPAAGFGGANGFRRSFQWNAGGDRQDGELAPAALANILLFYRVPPPEPTPKGSYSSAQGNALGLRAMASGTPTGCDRRAIGEPVTPFQGLIPCDAPRTQGFALG